MSARGAITGLGGDVPAMLGVIAEKGGKTF
jgi:hypothetical protein